MDYMASARHLHGIYSASARLLNDVHGVPAAHTVAASVQYGCSLHPIRLQARQAAILASEQSFTAVMKDVQRKFDLSPGDFPAVRQPCSRTWWRL